MINLVSYIYHLIRSIFIVDRLLIMNLHLQMKTSRFIKLKTSNKNAHSNNKHILNRKKNQTHESL